VRKHTCANFNGVTAVAKLDGNGAHAPRIRIVRALRNKKARTAERIELIAGQDLKLQPSAKQDHETISRLEWQNQLL
jgi:hypothetical protein